MKRIFCPKCGMELIPLDEEELMFKDGNEKYLWQDWWCSTCNLSIETEEPINEKEEKEYEA